MVRETLNNLLSRNGTRLSSEWAIDILLVSRIAYQPEREEVCMRVVSSRPGRSSAYAGAISFCGEHACTGASQAALLGVERHAVGAA